MMFGEIKHIYFETSAVNYLYDNVFNGVDSSSFKTKQLQVSKGRQWQISNIVLWEIFLTKNIDRRYELFDFSRALFHDDLISSPEEIIINYITSGCPQIEKKQELKSKSLFSKEWTMACKNFDYEFQPDREQLESFTNHFRSIGNLFLKSSKGYQLKPFHKINEVSESINGAFLKSMFNRLITFYGTNPDEEDKNYTAISLQVGMMILCYGIGFDQATIERFWNKDNITEPLERLEATIDNFPDVFFRGPIANIAKMIILQSNNKTGRGIYFDSLHTIYTTYCDLYVSNDEHFLKYKNHNSYDPNMHKIVSPKDLQLKKAQD